MKDKIKDVLAWCVIIFVFVGCNRLINTPNKPYEPTSIRVDIDDLNEIKDLANSTTKSQKKLLNEISQKVDEIIEHDRIKYEINQEQNEEARQNFIDEQSF